MHRLRFNGNRSIQQPNPFAHADEPQATRLHGLMHIESDTLIGDDEVNLTSVLRELDFDALHPAVLDSIMNRFL